nr:DNA-binding protein HEXBP-like isoform X2 [Dermacentor andersoni]
MEVATSRRSCGWGGMRFTWCKDRRNGGALEAGTVCWREGTPPKGELTTIYGDVRHWGPRRSARSTTGRTCVKCNQEGHMSRDCPTAASGGRRGCLRCGEEGHMSKSRSADIWAGHTQMWAADLGVWPN